MAWTTRSDLHTEGKAAIGTVAAPLVSPGQTIFLDAGSTVQERNEHGPAVHTDDRAGSRVPIRRRRACGSTSAGRRPR